MPFNWSIDTDPQQQEAASPQSVVVRSFQRYASMKRAVVPMTLILAAGVCCATSIKHVRNLPIRFASGSDVLSPEARASLKSLAEDALRSCSASAASALFAIEEILPEDQYQVRRGPTARTGEVRRALEGLGVRAIGLFEGTISVTSDRVRVVHPNADLRDAVAVELVCTPAQ